MNHAELIQQLFDEGGRNGGQGSYAWKARALCEKAATALEAQAARIAELEGENTRTAQGHYALAAVLYQEAIDLFDSILKQKGPLELEKIALKVGQASAKLAAANALVSLSTTKGEGRRVMGRESQMVTLRADSDGTPTVWCDPEIADLVDALNNGALATIASCSGHGYRPGVISLADGRELMIFDGPEHAKPAQLAYPVDVNGRRRGGQLVPLPEVEEPSDDGLVALLQRWETWFEKCESAQGCDYLNGDNGDAWKDAADLVAEAKALRPKPARTRPMDDEAKRIAEGLTEAMSTALLFLPKGYPTRGTLLALRKRGLVGRCMYERSELGDRVRAHLEATREDG